MTILGIDTSGKTASVALCDNESIIAETAVMTERTHSQMILPLCRDMLKNAGYDFNAIDGIAVSVGPGSYTGLRIGISAVKAIAFAMSKKCIGISTLEALAYNMSGFKGIICSVMSARQNLVYTALFCSENGRVLRLTQDRIMSIEELFSELLSYSNSNITLVGDYAKFCCYDFNKENITVSPPHLRLQKASGLCFAAFEKELHSASQLNAQYLQPTKAEKDRILVKKEN